MGKDGRLLARDARSTLNEGREGALMEKKLAKDSTQDKQLTGSTRKMYSAAVMHTMGKPSYRQRRLLGDTAQGSNVVTSGHICSIGRPPCYVSCPTKAASNRQALNALTSALGFLSMSRMILTFTTELPLTGGICNRFGVMAANSSPCTRENQDGSARIKRAA